MIGKEFIATVETEKEISITLLPRLLNGYENEQEYLEEFSNTLYSVSSMQDIVEACVYWVAAGREDYFLEGVGVLNTYDDGTCAAIYKIVDECTDLIAIKENSK